MKKFALLVWLLAGVAFAAAPVVSDVRGWQDTASGKVQVLYNLTDSDTPKLQVTFQVSADAGATWAVPATSLAGNGIGDAVAPGTGKLIVWDAKKDWPGQVSSKVRFKVNATDTPTPPAPTGFAPIPAGSFQMGDSVDGYEVPVHSVYVSAFYMEKNLVTKEQWDAVRAWGLTNGYTDLDVGNGSYASKGANHPVHSITWYAMVKWCNARSKMDGLTECYTVGGAVYKTGQSAPVLNMSANGYRLPTEAEWEKAARGNLSGKRFPWGDTINRSQANYYVYTSGSSNAYSYDLGTPAGYDPAWMSGGYPYTSPVGNYAANGYGLYDMAGNLWQWCWDWYGAYGSGSVTDPTGPASGSVRVVRGGSWFIYAISCRVAYRFNGNPGFSLNYFGFRCARSSVP